MKMLTALILFLAMLILSSCTDIHNTIPENTSDKTFADTETANESLYSPPGDKSFDIAEYKLIRNLITSLDFVMPAQYFSSTDELEFKNVFGFFLDEFKL